MITPDKIIRSRRRTVSLEITSDAKLIVRAPKRVSVKFITDILELKNAWIRKKLAQAEKLSLTHKKKHYRDGEIFLYKGVWFPLKINPGSSVPVEFDGKSIIINEIDPLKAGKLVSCWYRERCLETVSASTERFAGSYGFHYNGISVTNARSRWGSCGGKNSLNFSWRLAEAPPDVIDYVVVHELCHTEIKNHSGHFWAKVKEILPGYRKARLWLRDNRRLMDVD